MRKPVKWWYYTTHYYCPVCNSTTTYKSRRTTPRPDDWHERNEIVEMYDYCSG